MKKHVLITGGAGFIGSHLARELSDAGYPIRVLDHFSEQVHGKERRVPQILGRDIEVRVGDVRSRHDLLDALKGIDVVYHLAASVGVGQSMYEVKSYVDNNNLGTANLLQLLIEHPVERLIIASSMSLYGEGLYVDAKNCAYPEVRRDPNRLRARDWELRNETGEILSPIATPETKRPDLASIYALSKFDQERMCILIGHAYKIPTVALRFFNVYGRGQALSNPYTGVMAIFGSRLLNGQPPVIFEDGRQQRDFVHVSDVAQACRLALEVPGAAGHAINVGSGQQYTILEIARMMAKAVGKEQIQPEITQQYRVGDIRHCFSDISLAREILGYESRVTLGDGLQDLAEWLADQKAEDKTHQMRDELNRRGLAV